MVLKMGVGLGVAMGPAIGVLCMFGLFAFWAGELNPPLKDTYRWKEDKGSLETSLISQYNE